MSDRPNWFEPTLAFQLAANPQTWATLQAHGVTEESDLRLDFSYDAETQAQAQELASYLADETDYDVTVQSSKRGLISKRTWSVSGSTQPTRASLEILNDWVHWMVSAGAAHGRCKFDGWGTAAPPA